MTYQKLESVTRQAVCKTLGAKSKNFDKWLVTCNYNEDLEIDGFDLGTSVELSFDPSISPFQYFSSDVVFYVSVHEDGIGDMQVFFGETCQDVEDAEAAASEFLERNVSDGWYIEEDFDENSGLHLMREFEYDTTDETDLLAKVTACFTELCEAEVADELRSFVHYFEN